VKVNLKRLKVILTGGTFSADLGGSSDYTTETVVD